MAKVLIKELETDQVVETIECNDRMSAERVARGVKINLDHNKFYVVIESSEGAES